MERKVLRKTVVEVCVACRKAGQTGCTKVRLLQEKSDRVTVPECMNEYLKVIHRGQKNIFEYSEPEPATTIEIKPVKGTNWKGYFESEESRPQKPEPPKPKEKPVPIIKTVEVTDAPFHNWDETYTKILYCIKDNYTISKIVKQLNLPRSTIVDRLTKLEKKEIITKSDMVILGIKQKIFIISSGWAMKLVNNNEAQVSISKPFKPEPVKFTRHAVSLQAEIVDGTIPKGDSSYTPNGWRGEVFEGNGSYKIRVIPNKKGIGRAVVDIYLSLGASSSGDLTMKYHGLAEKFLGTWAQKHNIKLGQITEYRAPHTVIEGSKGLAQTIINATGGETKIKDLGVQVDESDEEHIGEVEFHGKRGEQTLRNFEFALNQSPEKMERLESKFDTLRDTLHTEVKKVGCGVTEIQGWLVLQRENDLLREQNQLLKEQITELKNQNTEMKSNMGMSPTSPVPKKGKWDDLGIYG